MGAHCAVELFWALSSLAALGVNPRALHRLGECCVAELHLSPTLLGWFWLFFFFFFCNPGWLKMAYVKQADLNLGPPVCPYHLRAARLQLVTTPECSGWWKSSEGKMGLRIDSNFPFLFSMALHQSRSDHVCTAKRSVSYNDKWA